MTIKLSMCDIINILCLDLEEAIARKDLDGIEKALHSVSSSSSFRRHLGELATKAEAMRSRLRRFKRIQHEVLSLDQKTISEIRSYPHPPAPVHPVMAATFMLLGNKEQDLKVTCRNALGYS